MTSVQVWLKIDRGGLSFLRSLDETTARRCSNTLRKKLDTFDPKVDPKWVYVDGECYHAMKLVLDQIHEHSLNQKIWVEPKDLEFNLRVWQSAVILDVTSKEAQLRGHIINKIDDSLMTTADMEVVHRVCSTDSHPAAKAFWTQMVQQIGWDLHFKAYSPQQSCEITDEAIKIPEVSQALSARLDELYHAEPEVQQRRNRDKHPGLKRNEEHPSILESPSKKRQANIHSLSSWRRNDPSSSTDQSKSLVKDDNQGAGKS